MPDTSVAITAGTGTPIDTYTVPGGDHRQVVMLGDHGAYTGNACTFRIPGRAGTTGQNLASIHNATGSSIVVQVNKITVDWACTVVKAVTVLPPAVRVYKVTVLPTNGAALTKVAEDSSATATSASVTLLQDASADGTSATTTLTATIPAGAVVAQEFAPRLITAVGYEQQDREILLGGELENIVLRPLEGLVVRLDYTAATQNPVTDMWLVGFRWEEFIP
jgi:hypothetical protein